MNLYVSLSLKLKRERKVFSTIYCSLSLKLFSERDIFGWKVYQFRYTDLTCFPAIYEPGSLRQAWERLPTGFEWVYPPLRHIWTHLRARRTCFPAIYESAAGMRTPPNWIRMSLSTAPTFLLRHFWTHLRERRTCFPGIYETASKIWARARILEYVRES